MQLSLPLQALRDAGRICRQHWLERNCVGVYHRVDVVVSGEIDSAVRADGSCGDVGSNIQVSFVLGNAEVGFEAGNGSFPHLQLG